MYRGFFVACLRQHHLDVGEVPLTANIVFSCQEGIAVLLASSRRRGSWPFFQEEVGIPCSSYSVLLSVGESSYQWVSLV